MDQQLEQDEDARSALEQDGDLADAFSMGDSVPGTTCPIETIDLVDLLGQEVLPDLHWACLCCGRTIMDCRQQAKKHLAGKDLAGKNQGLSRSRQPLDLVFTVWLARTAALKRSATKCWASNLKKCRTLLKSWKRSRTRSEGLLGGGKTQHVRAFRSLTLLEGWMLSDPAQVPKSPTRRGFWQNA